MHPYHKWAVPAWPFCNWVRACVAVIQSWTAATHGRSSSCAPTQGPLVAHDDSWSRFPGCDEVVIGQAEEDISGALSGSVVNEKFTPLYELQGCAEAEQVLQSSKLPEQNERKAPSCASGAHWTRLLP